MHKYILKIDGMRCGMCECHVDDVIRKNFKDAKKVKSSHIKGESSFISKDDINEFDFHNVFDPTGYRIEGIKKIEVVKKGLFYKEI